MFEAGSSAAGPDCFFATSPFFPFIHSLPAIPSARSRMEIWHPDPALASSPPELQEENLLVRVLEREGHRVSHIPIRNHFPCQSRWPYRTSELLKLSFGRGKEAYLNGRLPPRWLVRIFWNKSLPSLQTPSFPDLLPASAETSNGFTCSTSVGLIPSHSSLSPWIRFYRKSVY
ncbi:uncharacterized protein BO96DRAFT_6677 [Aspergillus niger CBS 101883]|uniref:uncharacterized protein n=1 Tax=Aspergillus lacticoffeatus (strain CBS 101883) TaxID=1450533 RepID=UPI000D801F27|nr:uncharacterized protein BO96DRAFT_6677 [Aspergillus niger CBS 101883]PYH61975.1 hypothetical protein BO96DRAFT_6677 [Aspergillus niger CBS 101883]